MNMMMQVQLKQEPQEPGLKPPDEASAVHNSTIASAARLAGEKRPKVSSGGSSNSSGSMNADQAQKCPRCDSLNTKFCYYNNYSLSQPRHFCKNCRRYWTKGGALRNVPVGGGCRKNKRIRQQTRSLDPNAYDESPSNILANISSNGSMSGATTCTPLLPCFGGPSTSGFSDMTNENQTSFGFTFSRLQESMRTGEQSGAVPSSQPNLFSLVPTSASLLGAQPTSALLNMPSFHPATYPAVTFDPSPTIKAEPGGLLYHGSELSTYLVDNAAQASNPVAMAPSTAIVPKLEDHLSSFSGSTSDSGSMEKLHHNSLALHNVVGHPEHQGNGEEHCGFSCNRNVQGFEEETTDGLINRRSLPMSFMKGKPFGEWQGAGSMAGEIMFGSASEASLWNASWPEMHAALAGTTMAGALLH